jgi:hypothetical protein
MSGMKRQCEYSYITFSPPIYLISNTGEKLTRISINKNINGVNNELIIQTPDVSSFGINRNLYGDGHHVKLFLCSNVPSNLQKFFVDQFSDIIHQCKNYLLQNCIELGLTPDYIKYNFNPIQYKNGIPVIYPKIRVSQEETFFSSIFYDFLTGYEIDPIDNPGDCRVRAIIKIEYLIISEGKVYIHFRLI